MTVTYFLYFGYMAVICLGVFLITGMIIVFFDNSLESVKVVVVVIVVMVVVVVVVVVVVGTIVVVVVIIVVVVVVETIIVVALVVVVVVANVIIVVVAVVVTYITHFCFILGTMGFFSCLYFNYQIYASIKVD